MRYAGIDLGDKRTGIAIGDDETRLAAPSAVLEVPMADRGGDSLIEAIQRHLEENIGIRGRIRPGLVVGLPTNMDGSEGPRAAITREFGRRLGSRLGLDPHFHDERLTSDAADRLMASSELTRKMKKSRRDALAAAVMLQSFLDSLPDRHGPGADSLGSW